MALKFPDGSVVGFATTIGEPVKVTEISNANPAVIKHAASALKKDDVLLIQSPWGGLNHRVSVAGKVDATAGTELRGIDTTDKSIFFEGRGAGFVQVASNFVDFSQQGELSSAGGEPKVYTGTHLENPFGQEFEEAYGQTARRYTLALDYDHRLPWYKAARDATIKRLHTVFRIQLPGGDIIYESGTLHFNANMNLQSGTPIKNAATLFLRSSEGTLIEAVV